MVVVESRKKGDIKRGSKWEEIWENLLTPAIPVLPFSNYLPFLHPKLIPRIPTSTSITYLLSSPSLISLFSPSIYLLSATHHISINVSPLHPHILFYYYF